jgi:hypothetical protein
MEPSNPRPANEGVETPSFDMGAASIAGGGKISYPSMHVRDLYKCRAKLRLDPADPSRHPAPIRHQS